MEEQQQIIWYLTSDSDVWEEGIVVGCDPDIGITIVDKADPYFYVCCMIGPSAPLWHAIVRWPEQEKRTRFERAYKLWSGMIANGFWNSQIDDIQSTIESAQASAQTCPFGQ